MKVNRLLAAGLVLGGLLSLSACSSGPRRLSRNWDEYVNQKYAQDSWIHGALLQDILPVYPIVGLVMAIGDTLVVNPYYFWAKDVQDRKGTAYHYEQPTSEKIVEGWGGEKKVAEMTK
ncbi:MAG: hypothetical protein H6830_01325 [Planctomycetes bacterium]|nr:hypothetical protein [Planctomycetota bacterium]MCB9910891.1 hypothetical protein [Planctomycetota bacterium]MCB9912102.1 hypothetical protein [Planctomycetota bacterium]HPF14355.1 hypothetical protein [Planctomycetota bacterium]